MVEFADNWFKKGTQENEKMDEKELIDGFFEGVDIEEGDSLADIAFKKFMQQADSSDTGKMLEELDLSKKDPRLLKILQELDEAKTPEETARILERLQNISIEARNATQNTMKRTKTKQIKNEKPRIGRNDSCSCGSGKKYKRCCGSGKNEAQGTGLADHKENEDEVSS